MSSLALLHDDPEGIETLSLTSDPAPSWLSNDALVRINELRRLTFSPAEFAHRRERALDNLRTRGADALVVFRPSSVEYLCGYNTIETLPQPLVVTSKGEFLLCVPVAELGRALVSSAGIVAGYYPNEDDLGTLVRWLLSKLPGGAKVLIEYHDPNVPVGFVRSLEQEGFRVNDGRFLVENLRLVLSPAELRCVERAAAHSQAGIQAAVAAAREPGSTDSSVAAAATRALIQDADSGSPWETVVATGPWGGLPHSSWSNVPIDGASTLIELTGAHHHYCSPIMRTIALGPVDPDVRRLASLASEMLSSVKGHMRPGLAAFEVARRVQDDLSGLLPSDIFHNTFGYSIGLARPPHWMDGAPFYIRADNEGLLREGMVFHLPGTFRSFARFAGAASETVVLESEGPRVLSHGEPKLIEI